MTICATNERSFRVCLAMSPWTDLTMSGSTLVTKDAEDPLIHKAYLEELAAAYLPPRTNRKDPRVSPLYAELAACHPR